MQISEKAAVLLNPRAHGGRGLKLWGKFLRTEAGKPFQNSPLFDGRGVENDLRRAAIDWVKVQSREGFRRFVAAGGDGTVSLLLNAIFAAVDELILSTQEFALGAVGLGSSNDFHKPFAAPGRSQAASLPCRLDFDSAFPHDVGQVEHPADSENRKSYFIVNASVGVTAEANFKFNGARGPLKTLKQIWTDGAILAVSLKTFQDYRNFPVTVKWDGQEEEMTLSNLGIVKNHHFAGSFRYDKTQKPDDGLFGLHLARDMNKMEMFKTLTALSKGKFSELDKTKSLQCRQAEIISKIPFAFETDGEVIRTRRAKVTLLEKEVFVCP